ncbi:MAG: hypothetical protein A3C06_03285 [Candidatus Taylorbacteria bacterium RIFCSPHIGHO2_02_FULL_46_13]|uniref:VOC domain-containing protein n=1 Tax=Candidatus Taylorbacteria bacterium RIFCSPHIGHO2_02_FULL_46_13 TaxID=1802312 RepID=A0A1G2MUF7_9BACT|nr:MAG: hypothetical protein A3C06_03285 [Candidatus Taylorbacteria bacterium RIFCSPHIGHO2_02_FULL_46_13]
MPPGYEQSWHFEIQAANPKRASTFYKNVFGWKIDQWGKQRYWMVMTARKGSKEAGINGGLLVRKGAGPKKGQAVNAFVCTVQVSDIDATIKKVKAAGGTVAVQKFAFPGMEWQAYYKDTEGNIFGIHQTDKKAK